MTFRVQGKASSKRVAFLGEIVKTCITFEPLCRSGSSRRPDFGPIKGDFQRRFSPKTSPPPPNPDEVCYVILDIASLRVTATSPLQIRNFDDIPFHNKNFPSIAKRLSQFCLSCFWVSVGIATEIRSKGRFANILNWHVGKEPRIKSTRFS